MKNLLKHSYKKVFLSLTLIATGVVTISSFLWTMLGSDGVQTPNLTAQEQVQSYKKEQAITGNFANYPFDEKILLEEHFQNLEIYVGQDIAKIVPKKVFSSNKSSYSFIERPYTGIYVQIPPSSANQKYTKTITKDEVEVEVVANAYDYVNLRWVYVSAKKDDFVIEPIINAPPPGLFKNNEWPILQDTNNRLSDFFPSKSIASNIAIITRLSEEFTKDEWYEKTNVTGLELNFANLNLNDVSELFNPNLIWGFGLVDLIEDSTEKSNQAITNNKREILYKGLTKLNFRNNVLKHLPNPNYDNMPALRSIDAGFNDIEAIGDFATYASDWSVSQNQDENEENSYYQYLQKLIKGEHKDRKEVIQIKNYLDELSRKPINNTFKETYVDGITNQYSFAYYLSRNPSDRGITNAANVGYSGYKSKLLNIYQVFFNVNKALYKLSLNNNQIEQLPLFKFQITILDVSNNKLRYVPPIKFQPLPINYLTNRNDYTWNGFRNSANWSSPLSLRVPSGARAQFSGGDSVDNSYGTTALPEYSFFGNQLLDFWPNQNIDFANSDLATAKEKSDKHKDAFAIDWFTWPNLGTSGQTQGRLIDEIVLKPTWPFHEILERNGSGRNRTTPVIRNTYITRNWYTYGFIGKPGVGGDGGNASASSLLGGLVTQNASFIDCDATASRIISITRPDLNISARGNEGCSVRTAIDFYGYKFAQKNDLVSAIGSQNFKANVYYKKDKKLLLPNFYTDTFKTINARSFSQEDANKAYYSMVPYLFGRMIPQNFSFSENGLNDKKIDLSFIGQFNQQLAPSRGRSYNWEDLYKAGLGTSKTAYWTNSQRQLSPATKELYFYNAWTGHIPYNPDIKKPNENIFDNPQLDVTTQKAGNNPEGIDVNDYLNDDARSLDLKINQTYLNINYSWKINIVNEATEPSASLKNGGILSIYTNPSILVKSFLQEASDPNFLVSNLSEWLVADPYIVDYLQKNPNAVSIQDINENKRSITVSFNVLDWNGKKLSIPDMTIVGFNKVEVGVYDNFYKKLLTRENEIRNFLMEYAGFVEDIDTNKKWIQKYFYTNIPGLDLGTGKSIYGNNNKTASWWRMSRITNRDIPDLIKEKGYYSFADLDDKYIINIDGKPGFRNLSFMFNLQVQKNSEYFHVLNIQSYDFDFFKELIIGFDNEDKAFSNFSVQELKNKFETKDFDLLKDKVTLSTSQLEANGITKNSTIEKPWTKDNNIEALITAGKIPKNTNLTFADFSYFIPNGNFSFNIVFQDLFNNQNPITLNSIPVFLDSFNLKESEFTWKTGTQLLLAEVNRPDVSSTSWSNMTAKQIYDDLKQTFENAVNSSSTANSSGDNFIAKKDFSSFNSLMGRILQYQETNNQGIRNISFREKKDFQDAWKDKIAITFTPNQKVSYEIINNLTVADFTNNIIYDPERLSIRFKNIVITGGYKHGFFYSPWEENAEFAPSILLPNNNVIFSFPNTTPVSFSLTPSSDHDFFAPAIEAWKQLLPSQWLQKLIEAQINSNDDNNLNYSKDNLETAVGFLNHLLYSNTSTAIYQTRAIIENTSNIVIDDLSGEIIIPANTIKLLNKYSSDGTVANTPVAYDSEIKFIIKGLFDTIGPSFWNDDIFVNENISGMSVQTAKETLSNMFNSAKEFYVEPDITGAKLGDAYSAIGALMNFFVKNEYRNNDFLNKFFITKFTEQNASSPQTNNFTQFSKIEYSNENNFKGELTIKVTVANYIKGFNKTTKKFEFSSTENENVHTFKLTNLDQSLFSPTWKKPDSNLGTLIEQQFPNVLIHNAWKQKSVQQFYDELKLNAIDGYISLYNNNANDSNNPLANITTWIMVDNFGQVINKELTEEEQQEANKIFSATNVKVKVDNLIINSDKTITIQNAVVHIENESNKEFKNFFYNPGNVEFDANNNIQLVLISELKLDGFKNEPAEVIINSEPIISLQLNNNNTIAIDTILPSELFILIVNNMNNAFFVNAFLQNYLFLSGSQTREHSLTLGFSKRMINDLVNNKNIQEHIFYNDGLGYFSINIDSLIVNNPYVQDQEEQQIGSFPLSQFLIIKQSQTQASVSPETKTICVIKNNFLSIQNLKLDNTKVFMPNASMPAIKVASNIKEATSQFLANDYERIKRILILNNIVTNDDDKTNLKIKKLIPNYQTGSIKVEFEIENYYENGILYKNHFGSFNLDWNFTSPIRLFLMIGVPIIVGTLFIIASVSFYLHYNHSLKNNSKKILKKRLRNS